MAMANINKMAIGNLAAMAASSGVIWRSAQQSNMKKRRRNINGNRRIMKMTKMWRHQ